MKDGRLLLAGMDEVGYGALAGPIVIVAAAFPKGKTRPENCRDSKKMSRAAIAKSAPELLKQAAFIGIGWASADYINANGIVEAWHLAANRALRGVPRLAELIVDGNRGVRKTPCVQKIEPKADATYWQVSAASIIAKHIRDQEMTELGEHYPVYDWAKNVGYGSEKHLEALRSHGPCPEHRRQFLRKILEPSLRL